MKKVHFWTKWAAKRLKCHQSQNRSEEHWENGHRERTIEKKRAGPRKSFGKIRQYAKHEDVRRFEPRTPAKT